MMEPRLMFCCSFWLFFEVFKMTILLSGDLPFMNILWWCAWEGVLWLFFFFNLPYHLPDFSFGAFCRSGLSPFWGLIPTTTFPRRSGFTTVVCTQLYCWWRIGIAFHFTSPVHCWFISVSLCRGCNFWRTWPMWSAKAVSFIDQESRNQAPINETV